MRKKYGSEHWFQAKSVSEYISIKDALKLSIVDPLEKLLAIQVCVFLVLETFYICRMLNCLNRCS